MLLRSFINGDLPGRLPKRHAIRKVGREPAAEHCVELQRLGAFIQLPHALFAGLKVFELRRQRDIPGRFFPFVFWTPGLRAVDFQLLQFREFP